LHHHQELPGRWCAVGEIGNDQHWQQLQWGTESNESTSSECCAFFTIFQLTILLSLTKKYKVYARCLRTTGEGIQSDLNDNVSDNKFFECYVPADGPNATTTLKAQRIWGMLLTFCQNSRLQAMFRAFNEYPIYIITQCNVYHLSSHPSTFTRQLVCAHTVIYEKHKWTSRSLPHLVPKK
jgi:hypothetical protein